VPKRGIIAGCTRVRVQGRYDTSVELSTETTRDCAQFTVSEGTVSARAHTHTHAPATQDIMHAFAVPKQMVVRRHESGQCAHYQYSTI
jgi:hypothetical protein